jgi:hypothetical protein
VRLHATAACEPLTVQTQQEQHAATIMPQILDGSGIDITGQTRTIYYVSVHGRATVTGSVTFHLFGTLHHSSPGVFIITQTMSVRVAIEELLLGWTASEREDVRQMVAFG